MWSLIFGWYVGCYDARKLLLCRPNWLCLGLDRFLDGQCDGLQRPAGILDTVWVYMAVQMHVHMDMDAGGCVYVCVCVPGMSFLDRFLSIGLAKQAVVVVVIPIDDVVVVVVAAATPFGCCRCV